MRDLNLCGKLQNNNHKKLAPIALFVYKRPKHTRNVLESLSRNLEFLDSPLYIYCDCARNSSDLEDVKLTRDIVRKWEHPNKIIIEQHENKGLADSIIFGVSELTEKYGKVIVVEDDLMVNNNFLSYLNEALHEYNASEKVMQISAYMFPVTEFKNRKSALFMPFISSWGWATWARAWNLFDPNAKEWKLLLYNRKLRNNFNLDGSYDYSDMIFRQMRGEINSWAIRWYWSVFKNSGLVLYPPVSLVRNDGFDGSGTHCRAISAFIHQFDDPPTHHVLLPDIIDISEGDFLLVKNVLPNLAGSFMFRTLKQVRSLVRRISMRISNS